MSLPLNFRVKINTTIVIAENQYEKTKQNIKSEYSASSDESCHFS